MNADIQQHSKQIVWEYWQQLDHAQPETVAGVVDTFVAGDISWNGPHPLNRLDGHAELVHGFWQPLLRAMPDLRRRTDILLAGSFAGNAWVCGWGNFNGTFEQDWLGIPAGGRPANLRWGEFCHVQDGTIAETYLLLDLVDLMLQAGYRVLPPSPGDEAMPPPPATGDGVLLGAQDQASSQRSLQLVEAMIGGLMQYDGANLRTMDQREFWVPDTHWYGPCGIGAARSYGEYEAFHQRPFLRAFPDRVGGNHRARLGDGNYAASTGLPSIGATHLGQWLGCPPTGKRLVCASWIFGDATAIGLSKTGC